MRRTSARPRNLVLLAAGAATALACSAGDAEQTPLGESQQAIPVGLSKFPFLLVPGPIKPPPPLNFTEFDEVYANFPDLREGAQVHPLPTGGALVATHGVKTVYIQGEPYSIQRDFVVRIDEQGVIAWTHPLELDQVIAAVAPYVAASGGHGYLVAGTEANSTPFLTFFDETGSTGWTTRYDGSFQEGGTAFTSGSGAARVFGMTLLSDSSVVLVGESEAAGRMAETPGLSSHSVAGLKPFVIVQPRIFDDEGALNASKHLAITARTGQANRATSQGSFRGVVPLKDGKFVAVGDDTYGTLLKQRDAITLRFAPSGSTWAGSATIVADAGAHHGLFLATTSGDAVARVPTPYGQPEQIVIAGSSTGLRSSGSLQAGYLRALQLGSSGFQPSWADAGSAQGSGFKSLVGWRAFGLQGSSRLSGVSATTRNIYAAGQARAGSSESALTSAIAVRVSLEGSAPIQDERPLGVATRAFLGMAMTNDLGPMAVGFGCSGGAFCSHRLYVTKYDSELATTNAHCTNGGPDADEEQTGKLAGADHFGDCGGSDCPACDVNCGDGVANHDETCVDGGGSCLIEANRPEDKDGSCPKTCAEYVCGDANVPAECDPHPCEVLSESCQGCHGVKLVGQDPAHFGAPCLRGIDPLCGRWAVTCGVDSNLFQGKMSARCSQAGDAAKYGALIDWMSQLDPAECAEGGAYKGKYCSHRDGYVFPASCQVDVCNDTTCGGSCPQ